MGEPDDPPLPSVKSKATAALGLKRNNADPTLPIHNGQASRTATSHTPSEKTATLHNNASHNSIRPNGAENTTAKEDSSSSLDAKKPPPWSPTRVKAGAIRFLHHLKNAITHSWINILLVFVPIGIAVEAAHLSPEIVFSMNAIAIIPLAGLLAHATEVVAARVGDALGALLNVSFGNAVELILFIILLASDQIEVVQASLLGSILANLLLILGMAFLLGGLKYQEQVSTSCRCGEFRKRLTQSRSTTVRSPR